MCLVWRCRVSCVALLLAVLAAPTSAGASTVFADVELLEDIYEGPVRFTAGQGETNRVRVSYGRLGLIFHDPGSRIRARGDCKSVDRHTATCSDSEDGPSLWLGDRNDRVKLRGIYADVHGGAGDDWLSGRGAEVGLYGGPGNDVLRGGGGYDALSGGPGRDRLFGGGGDDSLYDDETDTSAAPDIIDGGQDEYGDDLDFGRRRESMRIDLRRNQTSMGDTLAGVESVTGGSGDDRLTGDSTDNTLIGGPGEDVLRGGAGTDIPMGGSGKDRVFGGDGNDVVWGGAGRDRLSGGDGSDLMLSGDDLPQRGAASRATADRVTCGAGADNAQSDAYDTLEPECERLWAAGLRVRTTPVLGDDSVKYTVACPSSERCSGTLALHSLAGEEYGKVGFDVPSQHRTTVSVPLTPAGVAAVRARAVIQVDVVASAASETSGGYRMPLRPK